MDPALSKRVKRLLAFLIAVDVALCLVGFGWPALWFELVHGAPAVDPQRFLQRTAAAWAAFLVLQVIAYRRFRSEPWWLAVIAGVRWSDMFTDWTHALLAPDMTWLGYACLLSASPVNVLAGVLLIRAYAARGPGFVDYPYSSTSPGRQRIDVAANPSAASANSPG